MSIVTSKGSGTVEALSDELRRFAEEVGGRASVIRRRVLPPSTIR
jgi:hypothetical protein